MIAARVSAPVLMLFMCFPFPGTAAGNKKTACGRREEADFHVSSAHSFVLGLDGFEQSMQLSAGDYTRWRRFAQSSNYVLTNGRGGCTLNKDTFIHLYR